MKSKKIILLALLFALNFSIVHEYVFAYYDTEHCTVPEYIAEIEMPSNHDDICDIHFEYHQSSLLTKNTTLPKIKSTSINNSLDKESYNFKTYLNFYRPPIV